MHAYHLLARSMLTFSLWDHQNLKVLLQSQLPCNICIVWAVIMVFEIATAQYGGFLVYYLLKCYSEHPTAQYPVIYAYWYPDVWILLSP